MGERDLRLGFIEKSLKKGGKHYIQKHQAFAGSDFLTTMHIIWKCDQAKARWFLALVKHKNFTIKISMNTKM